MPAPNVNSAAERSRTSQHFSLLGFTFARNLPSLSRNTLSNFQVRLPTWKRSPHPRNVRMLYSFLRVETSDLRNWRRRLHPMGSASSHRPAQLSLPSSPQDKTVRRLAKNRFTMSSASNRMRVCSKQARRSPPPPPTNGIPIALMNRILRELSSVKFPPNMPIGSSRPGNFFFPVVVVREW